MSGTITALKIQKHCRDRVNVFLDDNYAFSIGVDLAADLAKGQHLPKDRIEQLKHVDIQEKAYQNALRFLASRPRSQKEVFQRLRQKGYPAETISDVMDRLNQANYLNDGLFASYWIENRERFRPRSAFALRHELRQKGVADAIIDPLLEDLDETESALRAAKKNLRRWQNLDREPFRQKLYGFLHRRGFGREVSQAVFHRLWPPSMAR